MTPEKWTKKAEPELSAATDYFVAGKRGALREWVDVVGRLDEGGRPANEFQTIETVRAPTSKERLRPIDAKVTEPLLEVVLHASAAKRYILEAFEDYALALGAEPELDQQFFVGALCFLPVRIAREHLKELAKFSFLRVARPMPKLRRLDSVVRSWRNERPFAIALPSEAPLAPSLQAAVFDGGVVEAPALRPWVEAMEAPGVGPPLPDFLDHGTKVTSALLFGPLVRDQRPPRPFASIHHYRVLDQSSGESEDLYDVLHRIRRVLQSRPYHFVNLSIGPDIPIEDDDVHGWTSALDDLLSSGETLACVAVGNGGERDAELRFNRVQVPADSVNALSIGAVDSLGATWERAPYSSIGPGRSPGLVKPDVVGFGGSDAEPFWVLDPDNTRRATSTAGTSFSSPAALRVALGIRAHFGDVLAPLAIRALLVHAADSGDHERADVGWGRLPAAMEDFVICPDGMVRIVYQGEIEASQFIRAPIPLPEAALPGNVTIRATFCYATEVDVGHPGNYTRSGLTVTFRPRDDVFDDEAAGVNPKSEPFFVLKEFSREEELRRDAHKWETVLHREKTKRGQSLKNPVFDIHHSTREGGRPSGGERMKYALVITVRAPKAKDLYDRVLRRYRTQISPLTPVIQIPVRT